MWIVQASQSAGLMVVMSRSAPKKAARSTTEFPSSAGRRPDDGRQARLVAVPTAGPPPGLAGPRGPLGGLAVSRPSEPGRNPVDNTRLVLLAGGCGGPPP